MPEKITRYLVTRTFEDGARQTLVHGTDDPDPDVISAYYGATGSSTHGDTVSVKVVPYPGLSPAQWTEADETLYRNIYGHASMPGAGLKRAARNKARRDRDQVRRDCGLARGRDSLGRVIWE